MIPVPMMYYDGGVPPPVPVYWNPSDKGASVVLADSNTRAYKAAAGWNSVRGDLSRNSGRRQFQITALNAGVFGGVADAAADVLGAFIGENNILRRQSAGLLYLGGDVYNNINAYSLTDLAAVSTGLPIQVVVDFSTNQIEWWVYGIPFWVATIAGTINALFPAASIQSAATSEGAVLNGHGPFAFDVPGCIPWGAIDTYPPVPDGTGWNPSDKGGSVVLSARNHYATKAGAGAQVVRGSVGRSSGQRYFEVYSTIGTQTKGVADASAALSGFYLGQNNAATKKSTGYFTSGSWYRNMTAAFSAPAATGGVNVLGVAVDFSTSTINMYNALTGSTVAAAFVDSAFGTLFPAASLENGSIAGLNDSGPFHMTVPSGYVAWAS